MDRSELVLPAAPPDDYLAWIAFWREVEDRMRHTPALEELASAESAPFMSDETAQFLSNEVLGAMTEQATRAQMRGDLKVSPALEVDRDKLIPALRVVAVRGAWLTDERTRAMGMEPLSPRLVALRNSVLKSVAEQLGLSG